MILKNVSRYYPAIMLPGNEFQCFCSEDGKDFYDSIPLFTKKYKLCIEPATGIISSISEDVSGLYPAGYTVVETETLPKGCDINGGWMYENEEVKAVPVDYVAKTENERQRLLREVNNTIVDWVADLRPGIISEDDKANLIIWRANIKSLKTMDRSHVKDEDSYQAIIWPEHPV